MKALDALPPYLIGAVLAVSLTLWLSAPISGAVAIGVLCGLIVPRLMDGSRNVL